MQIRNNESESRFEYEADGKIAVVESKLIERRPEDRDLVAG